MVKAKVFSIQKTKIQSLHILKSIAPFPSLKFVGECFKKFWESKVNFKLAIINGKCLFANKLRYLMNLLPNKLHYFIQCCAILTNENRNIHQNITTGATGATVLLLLSKRYSAIPINTRNSPESFLDKNALLA